MLTKFNNAMIHHRLNKKTSRQGSCGFPLVVLSRFIPNIYVPDQDPPSILNMPQSS